jgi:AraC-like DNA-binding protein
MLRAIGLGVDGRLAAEEMATGIILRALELNLAQEQELVRPATEGRSARDPYAHAEAVIQFPTGAFPTRVTLQEVSNAVGLSPFHLCRVFHAATGCTVHRYLLALRLEHAAAELLDTRKSVTEIAHAAGFSSHSHLTALFTRTFGAPPRLLRSNILIDRAGSARSIAARMNSRNGDGRANPGNAHPRRSRNCVPARDPGE